MESKLGKIVLYDDRRNPFVVISESDTFLRGLEIVQKDEECVSRDTFTHFKLSSDDFTKIKYRGKKLDNPIVDCCAHKIVRNIELREIGMLNETGYCRLLRRYTYHQAAMGANDPSYLAVRTDVHNQLVKMMNKGIYGI